MKTPTLPHPRKLSLLFGLLLLLDGPSLLRADAPGPAVVAFNLYSRSVESRLAVQHRSGVTFLAFSTSNPAAEQARLRQGEFTVERLTPTAGNDLPGALLHHWRATAFAPGATAADFERLMRGFNAYPQHFAPEVLQAGARPETPDRAEAWMRVRQHHVITVVLDTAYDVSFGRLDAQHGYSISQSTRIAEIASPGTPAEHALNAADEHGFLWRQNTYWSYEQGDGGLYLQLESISLTRAIPRGLGWAVGPYVESIPRESLEFTLRSAINAIRK